MGGRSIAISGGVYAPPVRLAVQWEHIQRDLRDDWSEAILTLTVPDEGARRRALGLLGPLNAGRYGNAIRFRSARRGAGPAPDHIRRLLDTLDRQGIIGSLDLSSSAEAPPSMIEQRPKLADAWAAAVAALPPDWSDVYAEVELTSSDYLERGALLLSPVNPARVGDRTAFRFRAARRYGYGASPEMVRRSLERLDEADITGGVTILRALSDTRPVATQGPVWYVGGKSV
jgi:hypothetical protein